MPPRRPYASISPMRKGSGLPERRGELDRLSERHGRPSSLGLLSGAEPECFAGWIEISALICGPESESRDIHTDLAHLGFRRPIEHEGPFEVAHPTCGHGHALHLDTCLGDVPVSQGGERATGVAPLGGSRIANGECTIAQVVQGIVFPSEVSEALARSEQLLGHRDSLVDPSERHQHLTHADEPAVDQPVLPFFPEDGEGLLHEFQRALVVVTQAMAPAQRLHRERPLEAVADLLPDSDGLLGSLPRSFEVSQPAKHHRESGNRPTPTAFPPGGAASACSSLSAPSTRCSEWRCQNHARAPTRRRCSRASRCPLQSIAARRSSLSPSRRASQGRLSRTRAAYARSANSRKCA